MNHKRLTIDVSGTVQGVYYRQSTVAEAYRLGLTGWVRNLPDGRVQLEAQGPADAVAELVTWCHKGPPMARVLHVEYAEMPLLAGENEFDIRYV